VPGGTWVFQGMGAGASCGGSAARMDGGNVQDRVAADSAMMSDVLGMTVPPFLPSTPVDMCPYCDSDCTNRRAANQGGGEENEERLGLARGEGNYLRGVWRRNEHEEREEEARHRARGKRKEA